jgi:hypothetical protein
MWHVVLEQYTYKTKGKYLLTGIIKNSLTQLLYFWTLSIVLCLFKRHNVSKAGFCLRLQVESTHFGPIDRASPYFWTIRR